MTTRLLVTTPAGRPAEREWVARVLLEHYLGQPVDIATWGRGVTAITCAGHDGTLTVSDGLLGAADGVAYSSDSTCGATSLPVPGRVCGTQRLALRQIAGPLLACVRPGHVSAGCGGRANSGDSVRPVRQRLLYADAVRGVRESRQGRARTLPGIGLSGLPAWLPGDAACGPVRRAAVGCAQPAVAWASAPRARVQTVGHP